MSIFDRRERVYEIWLEAIAITCVFVAPSIAYGPIDPDPTWIAVVMLASRYGGGGLLRSAVVAFSILGGTAFASARGAVIVEHLGSDANIVACGAALVVSWIGADHTRKQRQLLAEKVALAQRVASTEATNAALTEMVNAARRRADTMACSVSFLRDVATRIHGDDPMLAAEAAADLALARSGAVAVIVELHDQAAPRRIAARYAGAATSLAPAHSVPIKCGTMTLGRLTAHGAPPSMSAAMIRELEIIAEWCAPVLASLSDRPLARVAARSL